MLAFIIRFVASPLGYFLVMIPVQSVLSQPLEPATMIIAKLAPAWEIALIGSAAALVAGVFDYYFVRRVFRLSALERVRAHRLFTRVESYAKVAPFLTILVFAALPLPFFIPRTIMPLSGYPLPRYLAALGLGRLPRLYVLAVFGQIVTVPNWVLGVVLVGAAVLAGLGALARRLGWIGGPPGMATPPPAAGAPADEQAPPAA